jgi:hypothetical protein
MFPINFTYSNILIDLFYNYTINVRLFRKKIRKKFWKLKIKRRKITVLLYRFNTCKTS